MTKNKISNMDINIAKSGLMLILGGLICKFLGAFYRIPLSNILGAEGIGVYQILFPLYSFSLVFVGGGLTFALSRLVSKAVALNKEKSIPKYFMSGLVFVIVVGGVFFALLSFLSPVLESFQGVEGARNSYILLGVSVLFSGIIACFRGVFQGYNHMGSTVVSQLIEQTVKLVVGLWFSFLFLRGGIYWGVFGAFLGLAVSEFFAFVFYVVLAFVMSRRKKMLFFEKSVFKFKSEQKELFKLSVPVLVSSIMLPLGFGIQSLLVVRLLLKNGIGESLAKSYYGVLSGMVNSLISFPAIVATSLAVALVPSISFLLAKKQKQKADGLVKNVFKTLWVVSIPCIVGFVLLSENILTFVFFHGLSQEILPVASLLLKMASFQILFMAFVQVAVVLLQVLSKTWHAVFALLSFLLSNIVLMLVLTTRFGIYGLCTSNLLSYGICCTVCLIFLRNKFETRFSFKEVVLPIFASVLMGGIIALFKLFVEGKINNILFLIIVLIVCVLFYFGFLLLFKVISKQDLLLKNKTL